MKKSLVIIFVCVLFLVNCGDGKSKQTTTTIKTTITKFKAPVTKKIIETIDFSKLKILNGKAYNMNKKKPFTGKAIAYYYNGQKKNQLYLKNGKPHGTIIAWYKNGKKWFEKNYKNGIKHGKYIEWHNNGNKKLETNIKGGLSHGKWIVWDKNGLKISERNFKDGVEIK